MSIYKSPDTWAYIEVDTLTQVGRSDNPYNAPQKLDRAIRCMVACERTEGGRLNAHSETARCSIQGKGSA